MAAMNSVGVFREGEIDGKPFYIFTFPSQTHFPTSSSAIDSGGDNDLSLPQQPLFLCPTFREKVEKLKRKENGFSSDDKVVPFNTSPHFSNITSVDQQVQSLLDSGDNSSDIFCKLPLLPVFWCNNRELTFYKSSSSSSSSHNIYQIGEPDSSYYLCPTCDRQAQKPIVESPLEIKHPSYPFLSLQLYTSSIYSALCVSCKLGIRGMVYHCPTYDLYMHILCALKPIPIFIDHPKRHPHSLIFFPKQNSLLCNVCGVIKELSPTYVCARCVFVVHRDCIYFPYVIRISRHQHRISFTYSLPSGALSCGVCRRKLDNDYGAYTCNKCVGYFVHSRCALRKDLWDGEELEEVPEEPETIVEPFKTIADGIILHFSHAHHLKLEISIVYDDAKLCQACVLPIYEGNYYSCMDQCDFILHETCANAPLKKHHPLHAHPLTLKVVTNGYDDNRGHFDCDACLRKSCGFVYAYNYRGKASFTLDLRGALVSEPFKYEGHEHPLFLALNPQEERSATCRICRDSDPDYFCRKLNCIECDYILCFTCATLPYKAMYKHEKHLLTFREMVEASDESVWCEVCEYRVYSRQKGYYACDDYCCTALHVDCLLGIDPYMKAGQTIEIEGKEVHILRNNTMTRPFCHGRLCEFVVRCPDRVLFEKKNMTFCAYFCAYDTLFRM